MYEGGGGKNMEDKWSGNSRLSRVSMRMATTAGSRFPWHSRTSVYSYFGTKGLKTVVLDAAHGTELD